MQKDMEKMSTKCKKNMLNLHTTCKKYAQIRRTKIYAKICKTNEQNMTICKTKICTICKQYAKYARKYAKHMQR